MTLGRHGDMGRFEPLNHDQLDSVGIFWVNGDGYGWNVGIFWPWKRQSTNLRMLSIFSPNVYRHRGSVSARNHGESVKRGSFFNQSKRTSPQCGYIMETQLSGGCQFLAKGPCCEATALASIQLVAVVQDWGCIMCWNMYYSYGGYRSHRGIPKGPKSSKSWMSILVLKAMVTWGPPVK